VIALALTLLAHMAMPTQDGPAVAQAQTAPAPDPNDTIARFLQFNKAGQLDSADARALFSGELSPMRASTLGPLTASDKIIAVSDTVAVARLPANSGNPTDIYLYLTRPASGAWSIQAIRALALPPFVATLRNDLTQRVSRTDKDEHMLAQIDLMMRSDAQMRQWFAENRLRLDAVRTIALADRGGTGARRIEGDAARKALDEIHASALDLSETGAVVVTLGGIVDNAVGFLFAPHAGAEPQIGSSSYIWVEPVGNGWFLFKTT
jgi:hypothetical protein